MRSDCTVCGAPAEHGHHLTGRLAKRYLDPDLVEARCARCHRAEHARWVTTGLARPEVDIDNVTEVIELRLRRLAVGFALRGETDHAAAFVSWADLLAGSAA